MSSKKDKILGPWILYERVRVPGHWVRVEKKDVTGLVTSKTIRFCPHCGDRVSVSRAFGVRVADMRQKFTEGWGVCKGCGQSISVLPRFLKVPGMW